MTKTYLMLFAVLMLAACAKKDQETYSYHLTVNGCSTGEHTFDSKGAMCNALRDEAINHGCARSMRAEKFQAECGGKMDLYTTTQTYDLNDQMVASNSFSYQFVDNGCDTGNHSYPELAAMCSALQDDALNNHCASEMRQDKYRESCANIAQP